MLSLTIKDSSLKILGAVLVIVSLAACTMSKPNQKPLREKAANSGLVQNQQHKLDLSFYSPKKSLKSYSSIYIEPLNLAEMKIVRSSSHTVFETPWELNNEDRAYYQEKFVASATKNLIYSNLFKMANDANQADLILKTKVVEIAPLGPKDDMKGRPQIMKVYSEGFGSMTIVFEFYDAKTHELIATQMDEHDLGRLWEENNRTQNNHQIKLAFDYWLQTLKDELSAQTKS